MATPFEGLSLLENFSFVFPFLLVFVLSFGLFSAIKLFGNNKGVNAALSIILAILVLFSPVVRDTINVSAPWFVLLFFFFIFALIGVKLFGFGDADIMGALTGQFRYVLWWVVALALIISIGSLTYVVSQKGGVGAAGGTETTIAADGSVVSVDQAESFWATLFHPKILGFILIMLIAMAAVFQLTKS